MQFPPNSACWLGPQQSPVPAAYLLHPCSSRGPPDQKEGIKLVSVSHLFSSRSCGPRQIFQAALACCFCLYWPAASVLSSFILNGICPRWMRCSSCAPFSVLNHSKEPPDSGWGECFKNTTYQHVNPTQISFSCWDSVFNWCMAQIMESKWSFLVLTC